MQVVQRLLEVAVDGLPDDGRVEVFGDGQLGAPAEHEQGVEHDLERVDGELELAAHRVDELELDVLVSARVAERDQGPAVAVVVDFDHFADVGLLDAARGHAFAGDAFGEEVAEGAEDGALDAVVVAPAGELDGEDEVEIVVGLALGGEHVGGCAPVEADVFDAHAGAALGDGGLELGAHPGHQVAQPHVQGGEVAAPVDAYHLVHHVAEPPHLFVAEDC